MADIRPPSNFPKMPPISGQTRFLGLLGLIVIVFLLFNIVSLKMGGKLMGPTYIAPGNVGLVIDNFHGVIERQLMSAGVHWQGPWETVIEVPTAQRTISLSADTNSAVDVNTISNLLSVDVSAQYQIDPSRAPDLYGSYQDQFANLDQFEETNLKPAIKGAINYAIGDMNTADALKTTGKQRAETEALTTLNSEWAPRGIVFSNLMVRGMRQDPTSQELMSTTLTKMQDIQNAQIALQQQQIENATILQRAAADAKVNRLENSTLTDLYVQDQLLGQVKQMYMPSDELMDLLK